MNLTPNYIVENSNYQGERVNSVVQGQNNNSFFKRIVKNNFIFYGLMCSLSLFFLVFSRDLVKKSFTYQENQKYRVLEQKEDNKMKILRKLQIVDSDYDQDSYEENVNFFLNIKVYIYHFFIFHLFFTNLKISIFKNIKG